MWPPSFQNELHKAFLAGSAHVRRLQLLERRNSFVILSLEMGAIAAVGKQIVSTVLTFAIRAELQGHCELRYISSEA